MKKNKNYTLYLIAIILFILKFISNYFLGSFTQIKSFYMFSIFCISLGSISDIIIIMLCGNYFLNKEYNKYEYITNILKFGLSIMIFTIINILIDKLPIKDTFYYLFNPISSTIKFLDILFILYLISPLLTDFVKNINIEKTKIMICITLLFGLINLISNFININMIFDINCLIYIGYFLLGYLFNKYNENFKKIKLYIIIFVILYIYSSIITFFLSNHSLNFTGYLLNTLSIIPMIMAFCIYVFFTKKVNSEKLKFTKKYLLYTLLISQILFKILLKNYNFRNNNYIIYTLLLLIGLVLVSFIISFIFIKISDFVIGGNSED